MSESPVRIIRHLARTGGTLIVKCLACMPRVFVLSEIHPAGWEVLSPLKQAAEWHGLIMPQEAMGLFRKGPEAFGESMALIAARARERGGVLLVRDWSHVDYMGLPWKKARHGFETRAALGEGVEVRVAATVRHPVDTWLSLDRTDAIQSAFSLNAFLRGCREFAEAVQERGFVRYEDFTRDPDARLRELCAALEIEFDAGYRDRWWQVKTITGDTRSSRGLALKEIRPLERKDADAKLLSRFRSNRDYGKTLELLGYDD